MKKKWIINPLLYYSTSSFALFKTSSGTVTLLTLLNLDISTVIVALTSYPCSLSNCGYVTNNENMMFNFIFINMF